MSHVFNFVDEIGNPCASIVAPVTDLEESCDNAGIDAITNLLSVSTDKTGLTTTVVVSKRFN